MTVSRLYVDGRFFTRPKTRSPKRARPPGLLLTALHCEEVEKAREGGD